jgi:6-phosphogluconolactonase (cycloisomerase 2 family)
VNFPQAIAIDPTARFAYVTNSSNIVSGFTIDAVTGVLAPILGSPFATGLSPGAVATEPSGQFLYVANGDCGTNKLSGYTINATTGALTSMPPVPVSGLVAPQAVVVDPSGRFAYVAYSGPICSFYASDEIGRYTINAVNGGLTEVSRMLVGSDGPVSIAIAGF